MFVNVLHVIVLWPLYDPVLQHLPWSVKLFNTLPVFQPAELFTYTSFLITTLRFISTRRTDFSACGSCTIFTLLTADITIPIFTFTLSTGGALVALQCNLNSLMCEWSLKSIIVFWLDGDGLFCLHRCAERVFQAVCKLWRCWTFMRKKLALKLSLYWTCPVGSPCSEMLTTASVFVKSLFSSLVSRIFWKRDIARGLRWQNGNEGPRLLSASPAYHQNATDTCCVWYTLEALSGLCRVYYSG